MTGYFRPLLLQSQRYEPIQDQLLLPYTASTDVSLWPLQSVFYCAVRTNCSY